MTRAFRKHVVGPKDCNKLYNSGTLGWKTQLIFKHKMILFSTKQQGSPLFFLAAPCDLWDPSSPTRDWTQALRSESSELTIGPPGRSQQGPFLKNWRSQPLPPQILQPCSAVLCRATPMSPPSPRYGIIQAPPRNLTGGHRFVYRGNVGSSLLGMLS